MALRTALAALCLSLPACAEEARPGPTASSPEPERIVLELRSDDKAPIGMLSYGGEDQAGELGTHCWATRCVDFIGPPTPKTFTPVPGDGVIEVSGDGEVESLTVGTPPAEKFGQLGQESEVPVRDGRAELDLEPGRYMLVAFARWEQGDAVLAFGLEVS